MLNAVVQPLSATPIVALAVGLLMMAVAIVFCASYLFHWRSRRR